MIFRKYTSADADVVKQLHKLALRDIGMFKEGPWNDDLDDIAKNYLEDGGEFIVGLEEDEIVAMGAFKVLSNESVEIKRMRVLPSKQGEGIGGLLLRYLEDEIRSKGYKTIELHTTVKQLAAQKLYEKNGYLEYRRAIGEQGIEIIYYSKAVAPQTESRDTINL